MVWRCSRVLNISGNFNMMGGTYHFNGFGGSVAQNVTVTGNATISGGALLLTNATGGSSLFSVRGNFSHTAGTFGNGASVAVGTLSMASTTNSSNQTIVTTGFSNQVNLFTIWHKWSVLNNLFVGNVITVVRFHPQTFVRQIAVKTRQF